ncbi:glycosyltransferase [Paenibacillus sp. YIM B09110]|uniref:glycosyltransferase n=1 Tax=Paenibacillus sp. YIM B09110 TaxID=3126102 RepID=UPI00301D4CF1
MKQVVLAKGYTQESEQALSKQFYTEKITGVNLIGYSRAEMGLGESCRIAARSLENSKLPYDIISYIGTSTARMSDLSWQHKEVDQPKYNINIFHINAEQMLETYIQYGTRLFEGRYNIGYWHWELPEFPEDWMDGFKFVHEVWVPSNFVAQSISMKSPVPVVRIPHGIEVKIDEYRTRAYYQLPELAFLFLTMYDVNSYQERKNPIASIHAFKQSFQPNDMTVGLVIKVNNVHANREEIKLLHEHIQGYNNIYIITQILSRNDTNALIQCTDSYISLHRGEGFGLVMAEAMYLRKPVVATNWSSNTDFMNEKNSCLVDYELIPIGKDYGPYQAFQKWANPNVEHASSHMKRLVNDAEFYNRIALKGQQTIKNDYSPSVIGKMIEERLNYIQINLGG